MKKYGVYIGIGLVIVFLYLFISTMAPRKIDWQPTFQNKHKIPYGTRALFEMMNRMPQYSPVTVVHQPIYNQLNDYPPYYGNDSLSMLSDSSDSLVHRITKVPAPLPDSLKRNYIFINSTFEISESDLNKLLEDVNNGDDAFIAAYSFSRNFVDTFKLHTNEYWQTGLNTYYTLPKDTYQIKQIGLPGGGNYGTYIDSACGQAEAIGFRDSSYSNFIRIKYGRGYFYINTSPEMFTNFYVLNDTAYTYAFNCLGMLDGRKTWWDEYYKAGREESDSLLRYVMSQDPLKMAWYVMLFTAVMFALFESKRRQKAIPVVKPLRNDSLEFIKSLAGFYFKTSQHSIMAAKKWTFLAEHLRTRHNLVCDINDSELPEKISRKTMYPKDKAIEMIMLAQQVYGAQQVSAILLLQFNQSINQFYNFTK